MNSLIDKSLGNIDRLVVVDKYIQENLANLDKFGIKEYDSHLKRNVIQGIAVVNTVSRDAIDCFQSIELLDKYKDDFDRMEKSGLLWLESEVLINPNSRQLIAFNVGDFFTTFECFNMFQFCKNNIGHYTLIIYQRSQDMEKMKYDIRFFLHVIQHFEQATHKKITGLVITYGNLHKKTE